MTPNKKNKNKIIKWTIIISLIIVIIFFGISFDSFTATTQNTNSYSSFVGQAYKASAKMKEIDMYSIKNIKQSSTQTSQSCKETDNIGIVPTGFQPFIHGKITFQELVKQTQGVDKKSTSKFITTTLSDNCKDFQYLIEYSCDNYVPKSLYKISEKLYSVVKCDYGCSQQFGKCNTQPSCDNKVKDSDELAVDCGGESCKPCPNQQFCKDSDGLNYETKGFATVEVDNNDKKEKMPIDDYCKENILYEQACTINGYKEEQYDCIKKGYEKCEDGRCTGKENCVDSDIHGDFADDCYGSLGTFIFFGGGLNENFCDNNKSSTSDFTSYKIINCDESEICYGYKQICKAKTDLFCYKTYNFGIVKKEYYIEGDTCIYQEKKTEEEKVTFDACRDSYFVISDGSLDKLYVVKILNWKSLQKDQGAIEFQFNFNVNKYVKINEQETKYVSQEKKSFPFTDGKETTFEYEGIKFILIIDTQKKSIFFKDLGDYPQELQNIQCS